MGYVQNIATKPTRGAFQKKSLLGLLSFFYFFSVAQEPAYLNYSIEEGMPSTLVYCMLQSRDGFIWFGTNNGAARFDGQRFKVYGVEDGLPDPEVLELYEDSKGRIWIACFQQQPCFFKDGKIENASNNEVLEKIELKNSGHEFYEADDRTLIVVDWKKACIVRFEDNGKIAYETGRFDNFSSRAAFWQRHCPEFGELFEKYGSSNFRGIKTNVVFDEYPCAGKKGGVYFFAGKTVVRALQEGGAYKEENEEFGIPDEPNLLRVTEGRNLWAVYSSQSYGVFKINFDANEVENYLPGKQVMRAMEDTEGAFWFGTFDEGVYVLPKLFTSIYHRQNTASLMSQNITAVSVNGTEVLVGDVSGNMCSFKNGAWERLEMMAGTKGSRIRQIEWLDEGTWVAIMDNGVRAMLGGQPQIIKDTNGVFGGNLQVMTAPKCVRKMGGRIYMGGIYGLFYWDELGGLPQPVYFGHRVTAVELDSEKNVWVGGVNGLLSQMDSFQTIWGAHFEAIGGRIVDIRQPKPGKLWVVSADKGLLDVDIKEGQVTKVKVMNDLFQVPINNIKHVFIDHESRLWLPTNTGVYAMDSLFNIVRHVDVTDGLPINDVNAVAVQKDTLWAATTSGLAKVPLSQPQTNGGFKTLVSGVRYELDGMALEEDLIHFGPAIDLPPGATGIDIELSGLHFNSGKNIRFEYIEEERLLPLQWLTWGNLARTATAWIGGNRDTFLIKDGHRYIGSHAPRGRFDIKVTAIAKDGTRSMFPDRRVISLLPNWYGTIWFTLAILGLAGYFLSLLYLQYTKAKRYQRAASELQLQAIKAQVNPHFIGNSINAIQQFFYPPDPVRASEYISTFTSLLRQTMHLSEVPFIPFGQEVGFITDYLNMVQLRFGDKFEYSITGQESVPKSLPYPAMLLQPLLENATVHGFSQEGVSRLSVIFKMERGKLFTTIQDNGIGIEMSRAIKQNQGVRRVSKGIQMLRTKISVLNKMHRMDISLDFLDLSSLGKKQQGTSVTLVFSTDRVKTFGLPPS